METKSLSFYSNIDSMSMLVAHVWKDLVMCTLPAARNAISIVLEKARMRPKGAGQLFMVFLHREPVYKNKK